ncbi:MAG: Mitochondrial inner membrane protein oxa1l, partial [Paramarteilia canceri]
PNIVEKDNDGLIPTDEELLKQIPLSPVYDIPDGSNSLILSSIENSIVYLNSSLNMPWIISLGILSILLRSMITPFNFWQFKLSIQSRKLAPKLKYLTDEYEQALQQGATNSTMIALEKLQKFLKNNKYSPYSLFKPMIFQTPLHCSAFCFIRHLTSRKSLGMENAGILWFNDLTIADPYYILPVISSSIIAANIFVQTPKTVKNFQNLPLSAKIAKFSFLIPIAFIPITCHFQS